MTLSVTLSFTHFFFFGELTSHTFELGMSVIPIAWPQKKGLVVEFLVERNPYSTRIKAVFK